MFADARAHVEVTNADKADGLRSIVRQAIERDVCIRRILVGTEHDAFEFGTRVELERHGQVQIYEFIHLPRDGLLVLTVIACLEKEEAAALMEEAQDAAAEDAVDAALSAAPADPPPSAPDSRHISDSQFRPPRRCSGSGSPGTARRAAVPGPMKQRNRKRIPSALPQLLPLPPQLLQRSPPS